jgi:two-component system alkaline phosphatase synthesis response regulator PhoP
MSEQKRVLVVEDESAIMLGLEENLRFAGYEVLKAVDGPGGYETAVRERPDAILLDIMLPGLSGFEVCRQLRAKGLQMPVIMLTARGDAFDKLHGFEMGADDYVTKPFSVDELLARLKAVLRRGERQSAGPRTLSFDDITLDLDARTMTRGGGDVIMTRTEFDLLVYFIENEGKALSRDMVMNDVWGLEYYGTQRSLDSFVANLRKKIEKDPHDPAHIHTVHGVGYKFSR